MPPTFNSAKVRLLKQLAVCVSAASVVLSSIAVAQTLASAPAQAKDTQGAAGMIVINPGGGDDATGADGLQAVFNGVGGYRPANVSPSTTVVIASQGYDQQYFANTTQWCCGATGPMLNVAGTLVGEAGAAYTLNGLPWTNVSLLQRSGAVGVAQPGSDVLDDSTSTGDATVTIRYEWLRSGDDTYIVDRQIVYTYPNNFYVENYTFTIPQGSTGAVKFYQGGDAAPGNQDNGTRGLLVTSPRTTVYEVHPTSSIFVAYGEVEGALPFSGYYAGSWNGPYTAIRYGENLPNTVTTFAHDAGLDMQWTLGDDTVAPPGVYQRSMRTTVGFLQVNLSATFPVGSIFSTGSAPLEFEVVNLTSVDDSVTFDYTLPAGLLIAGAASNTCGGSLTAITDSATLSISGGTVLGGASCLVSVPVKGPVGSYTVVEQSISATAPLVKGFGSSTLQITAAPNPDPTPAPVAYPPSAPRDVNAVAGDASATVSWAVPSDPGSFAITDYQVVASPGSGTCLVKAPELSCRVSGLTNGTAYTFKARALNGAGWGAWSEVSAPVTPVGPPAPVGTIQITGSRGADAELPTVTVNGVTTNLVGVTVQARVRLPGELDYANGSERTVRPNGTFTWQRKTKKTVYVYFRTIDGDVRSNRVIITLG